MAWRTFAQDENKFDFLVPNNIKNEFTTLFTSIRFPSARVPLESYATCERCNGKKIDICTRQTRSLDEGATTFFSCFDCHYKWKKN
jgi:DNA-directed RNA polymerase subunit M/transcription elongation factor TFIIS